MIFFFKQKTAYEMRISDWSSDVCSSDLELRPRQQVLGRIAAERQLREQHHVGAMKVARLDDHRRDALGVAGDGADGEVELGEGEADSHSCLPFVMPRERRAPPAPPPSVRLRAPLALRPGRSAGHAVGGEVD